MPGKITGACGYLFQGLCKRARGLRTLQGAATIMAEDLGLEYALETAAEYANKIGQEESLLQIVAEFFETEKQLSRARQVTRSLTVLADEVRNIHNGVIPFDRVDLLEDLKILLKEFEINTQTKLSAEITNQYAKKVIIKNGKKYDINLDINHILNIEFDFLKNKSLGGYKIKIKGGHFSGKCKMLEEIGLVKIIKKKNCVGVESNIH